MAGSWAQIDPRLRGDEADWYEEEEYEEAEIQPSEAGSLGYNPQIGSSNYDPQLDHDRRAKKEKLQQRFEHIFEKYGRDFEGIGDEIDLETGLIVVDNGHLKNMQHEADPGYPEAADFANPSASNLDPALEQEFDQNIIADSGSDAESEDVPVEDDGQGSTSGEASNGVFSIREQTEDSATTSFETEDSAAELGAKSRLNSKRGKTMSTSRTLRGGPRIRSRKRPIEEVDVETDLDDNSNQRPADIYEQMQSLKASMLDLQSKHKQGQGVDHNDIEALGMSIARQLADFVGRDNKSSSKPTWHSAKDPMWSYPELPKIQYQQQHPVQSRVRSPTPLPLFTGPSPGQKSLWAPMQHPRGRKTHKRRKGNPDSEEDEETSNEFAVVPENIEDGQMLPDQPPGQAPRTCTNCECTNSLIWRSGPDGDLCNACGMYYYRYGLLRPLETFSETEESDVDEDLELDPSERHAIDDAGGRETTNHHSTSNRRGKGLLKNSFFTIEDDGLIIKLKEIDRLSWEKIAKHFPGRTAYGVQCRYSKKLNNRPVEARAYLVNQGYDSRHDENGVIIFAPAVRPPQGWTDDEDDLLLKLREEDKLEWDKIAGSFSGRTARAMERRFTHLAKKLTQQRSLRQKKKSKKITRMFTKYTTHEDEQLIQLREVDKLSWADIALRLPGRNAMALQKRYVRELAYRNQELGEDPLVEDEQGILRRVRMKHSRFSREEDDMLLHARNDLGLDWKEIELRMPGRKWNSLEGRYQYITKGFSRYLRFKDAEDAEAPPGVAEDSQKDSSAEAEGGQSEDELIQDAEDISSVDPCPPPSLQHVGQSVVDVVPNKETASGQDQSPNGHGFFIEGGMPFTAEEDTRIRQLRELEKLSWEEIAARLPGRKVSAISARYYHTLFPRSESVNPLSKEAATTSFFAPKTLEIATRVNLAASGIASKRTLRWTKEESDMVVHYYNQGLSFEEIGEQMPWRSHKAIKHFYTTKIPARKSKGKLVAPTSKNDLLRRAVGNNVRQSMPPLKTHAPLIDLTGEESGDESPSRKAHNLERHTYDGRPQLRKLLPRPAPGDENGRLHRKYAANISTPPPKLHRAPVPYPLPHGHPPSEPASVEAYASLLSHYLAGRESPTSRYYDAAPSTNPLTPSGSQQEFQRSSAPGFNRTARTIHYFTPLSHTHAHPYFVPPPANRHVPLFNTHGLSSSKAVIDPRLLEDRFSAPPPVLSFARSLPETARSSLASPTSALNKTIIMDAVSRISLEADQVEIKDQSTFIDLSAPDPDQFLDDAWQLDSDSGLETNSDAHNPNQDDATTDHDAEITAQLLDDINTALSEERMADVEFDGNESYVANESNEERLATPETVASTYEDGAVEEADASELPDSESLPDVNVDILETVDEKGLEEGSDLANSPPHSRPAYAREAIDNVADPIEASGFDGDESDLEELPVHEMARGTPPPYSCEEMLLMAFSVNTTKPMNVKDIYKFIEGRFPYFKNNPSAWKEGIQSCLEEKSIFVQVSRFRPLWVFRSAPQQMASGPNPQSSSSDSIEQLEQLEHEQELKPQEQPVRLITVKSLRERPPKVEQAGPVKRGPGRPRKAQRDDPGPHVEPPVQVEQKSKARPNVLASGDRDELAPSPNRVIGHARASSILATSVKDINTAHAPSFETLSSDITIDPGPSPNVSVTQDSFTDAADDTFPEPMSELSNVSNSLLSSSSPLRSVKTPHNLYTIADTPGTGQSTLFGRGRLQHRGVAALRSSFGPGSVRSRSSSVALPGCRKRVLYTPVRDVEGDEDELA